MKASEVVDAAFVHIAKLRHTYHNRCLTARTQPAKDSARAGFEALAKLPMRAPEAPWPLGDTECVWKARPDKQTDKLSTAMHLLTAVKALDTVITKLNSTSANQYKKELDALADILANRISMILFSETIKRSEDLVSSRKAS